MTELSGKLKSMNACHEAVEWVADQSPYDAWRKCERGDWMLWIAAKLEIDRKIIVQAACDCAEQSLRYTDDPRPAEAIRIARLWCIGKADISEVRAAYAASDAASAVAAYAAAYAASAATAAAYAAYAATAAYAAYVAATAADDAAYVADDAAYVADAEAKSLLVSAKLVRKRIPFKLIKEALANV